MTANTSESLKRPSDGDTPARKLRKGTQSCWECKRRKVRCTFAQPEHSMCEPCRQRETLCVPQDMPDPGRTSQTEDRISRVESVLEEVLRRLPDQRSTEQPFRPQVDADHREYSQASNSIDSHRSRSNAAAPAASDDDRAVAVSDSRSSDGEGQVSRSLMTAVLTQREIEVLARESFQVPSCLLELPCTHHYQSMGTEDFMKDLMGRPTDSSLILLARKLLLLGSVLQNLSQSETERLRLLGIDYQRIAADAVKVVRRHVLSDNELMRSMDGIECLAIDSMYYNNAGQLSDAWITLRRAISNAQVLGVHHRAFQTRQRPLCYKRIEEETIWFHLMSSDRYLSMMLGLPQAAPESNGFALPEALAPFNPVQRLHRTHCLAGRIILKHVDQHNGNSGFIEEVDVLLREAAESLEPQWWLVPDMSGRDGPISAEDTFRLMVQFTHFHILARLHLPYLLRAPADGSLDHHKLTTITASREILTRYVALRESGLTNNYCRGVDFLMFIAATTLCLAHINSSHWRRHSLQRSFDFLAHQRPSDRGLMERALHVLKTFSRQGKDDIETQISNILQPLLQREATAAVGGALTISTALDEDASELNGQEEGNSKTLKITIPYVGVIKIEKQDLSAVNANAGHTTVEGTLFPSTRGQSTQQFDESAKSFDQGLNQDWPLQGVDVSLFNDLIRDWDMDAFST